MAAAEKVMSKENQKLGYCSSCDMNVPHWRGEAKGLQGIVFGLMQKVQLGHWHCLKCERVRYFLRFVSDNAVDYRIGALSDPVDSFNAEEWLCSVDDDELDCGLDISLFVDDQVQQPIQSNAKKTLFVDSSKDKLRDTQQSASGMASEVAVAEPVGNFIKEKSLAVKATRLKRFTEKYRDALVDRIMSGKARMSWLIADGKFTEAELVSWIDDKARRESIDEDETIELNAVPRKRDLS